MLRFKKPETKNEAPKNKLRRAFKPEGKAVDSGRSLPSGDSRLSLFSICLFALLLYGLQVRGQAHLGWIVLLTPAHAVLAWQLRRRPGQAGAR